ncbi:MAG TPA: iron-containing redox enzyme family protein [Polyangiaceae bacterium]|jgi:pyrroloquinoline-quinone synthase|nr:iron-containing redox enzyme family protein [Polyangiaceae bacterium]
MDREDFKEALLGIMERKTHWAWPSFNNGTVRKELLHVHLEQEYATYVRDFPIMVARAYIACPIAAVRRELIENVYEEETGGIHAGKPHPELFLEYPRGLGMDLSRFDHVTLLPSARAYREFLDEVTSCSGRGWEVAAAVTTLFVEGTAHERGELDSSLPRRAAPPLEQHPLVVHYGLPLEHLELTKAHRAVEGEHRAAAWRVMLDHAPSETRRDVVDEMRRALTLWLGYRDGVAEACGLSRR